MLHLHTSLELKIDIVIIDNRYAHMDNFDECEETMIELNATMEDDATFKSFPKSV